MPLKACQSINRHRAIWETFSYQRQTDSSSSFDLFPLLCFSSICCCESMCSDQSSSTLFFLIYFVYFITNNWKRIQACLCKSSSKAALSVFYPLLCLFNVLWQGLQSSNTMSQLYPIAMHIEVGVGFPLFGLCTSDSMQLRDLNRLFMAYQRRAAYHFY